jgi:tyrosyl-tRNA synthetase
VLDHPEQRQAQRTLAREVTRLVHGPDEAARAERAAAVLFTEDIGTLDEAALAAGLRDAPTQPIAAADLDGGLGLADALIRAGLASSRGDARRQLSAGAIYVNNRRQPADRPLAAADALHGRFVVLRRGRSQYVLAVEGR